MRTLLASAALLVAAGCGTTTPVPTEAHASADGLAAYLADRGADVSFALPGVGYDPVDGAELTVLQVGRPAGPAGPFRAVRPRDRDYRTPADLGHPLPWPPARTVQLARAGAYQPALLRVYRFEGAVDLGAIRGALGPQASGLVAYADGPLVVVAGGGVMRLALQRAFGDPRSL